MALAFVPARPARDEDPALAGTGTAVSVSPVTAAAAVPPAVTPRAASAAPGNG